MRDEPFADLDEAGPAGPDDEAALRLRALRLLTRREHSRFELAKRLSQHAPDRESLDALLDDLESRHMLSDARFVEQRVAGRASRFGNRRLSMELKQQGIDADAIDQALSAVEPELDRARQVWARKFREAPADRDERARQTRFLLQRGFSQSTISQLFKALANNAPET